MDLAQFLRIPRSRSNLIIDPHDRGCRCHQLVDGQQRFLGIVRVFGLDRFSEKLDRGIQFHLVVLPSLIA